MGKSSFWAANPAAAGNDPTLDTPGNVKLGDKLYEVPHDLL